MFNFLFFISVVPDIERVIQRFQHGLQYDWNLGTRV